MTVMEAEVLAPEVRDSSLSTVDGLFELGLCYSTGRGVPHDLVLAHKWLNLAAQQGSDAARRMRAEIAQDMTPAQIAEAQRLAREWQRTRH